jgi:hypothetical protein
VVGTVKNAGKVSKRNAQRLGTAFYEELWWNSWDYHEGLNMAAVASFILEECDQNIDQLRWLCEYLLETDRRSKNSSHLHDLQPKKWNMRLGVLQIRYFVSGQMSGMLGMSWEKRNGSRISYWISPIVALKKRGNFLHVKVDPEAKMEQVEDKDMATLNFTPDPETGKPLAFSDIVAKESRYAEVIGVMDFTRPKCIRILQIQ